MNRQEKRKFYKDNTKRIKQLMSSKVLRSDRFSKMSEKELSLLKERKHEDKELQDFYNLQEKLTRELDYLLRKR